MLCCDTIDGRQIEKKRKSGYTRSYTSLVRMVNKWIKPEIKKCQTKKPQPYARAEYPGQKVQTDNGTEFTRALIISNDGELSLFEKCLENCNIKYHRIRVATPRHNGKVERQHRTDELRFYKKIRMYNLEDGRQQLAKYNAKSNNIPKICLGFLTSNEVLAKYLAVI